MADTEQQEEMVLATDAAVDIMPEEVQSSGFWDNDTKAVPEHYIETFTINPSHSDMKLLLGKTYREQDSRVDLCKLRLIMTHRDFLEFAEDVRKAAAMLTILYRGVTPGLDTTSEELDAAYKEVYGDD